MKKIFTLLILSLLVAPALALEPAGISPDEISLKAGPTEPGEALNLVWLEALVYPKEVVTDRSLSLGVKLTAKVDSVTATFDFANDRIPLKSTDGLDWKTSYQLPDGAAAGLHIVRYVIKGKAGEIQRTVEFFIKQSLPTAEISKIGRGETVGLEQWPLTVTATCAALVGASSRLLYPGQKVTGISKTAWYQVIFEDGEEGWVPATVIKEPVADYMAVAFNYYFAGKDREAIKYYKNVLAVNPEHAKAYFWLAKIYLRQNDLNAALKTIKEAIRLDGRDLDNKVIANTVAQKFFDRAHLKYREGRYNEAIAAYQKIIDLKPNSILSWLEMGQCYRAVGLMTEARNAWREVLRLNPDNLDALALLNGETLETAQARGITAKQPPVAKLTEVPAIVADDSLALVKIGKTKKGTKIENAIRSVIALTKSLGTPIAEKGWQINKRGTDFSVRYVCEQGNGNLEAFEWLVNVDTKRIVASNENAQLLMDRW